MARRRPKKHPRSPEAVILQEKRRMAERDLIAKQEWLRLQLRTKLLVLREADAIKYEEVETLMQKSKIDVLVTQLANRGLIDRTVYNIALYESVIKTLDERTPMEVPT